MSQPRTCKNCQSWEPNSLNGGEYTPIMFGSNGCRHKSPKEKDDFTDRAIWPKTGEKDSCGSHRYAGGTPHE